MQINEQYLTKFARISVQNTIKGLVFISLKK